MSTQYVGGEEEEEFALRSANVVDASKIDEDEKLSHTSSEEYKDEKLSNTSSSSEEYKEVSEAAGHVPALETLEQPKGLASVPYNFDSSAVSHLMKLHPLVEKVACEFEKTDDYKEIVKRYPHIFRADRHGHDKHPSFCSPEYIAMMKEDCKDPGFVWLARVADEVFMQDQSVRNLILGITGPEEEREERMKRAREDLSLKPILDDMENGTIDTTMKDWNAQEIVRNICKALLMNSSEEINEDSAAFGSGLEEDDYIPVVYTSRVLAAAQNGDLEGLKAALEKGGDIDEKDELGWTALHLACGNDYVSCAEFLIENGAKVDASDKFGNTPLHYAAGCGHVDCVKLLVNLGVSRKTVNNAGETARELAKISGEMEAVEFLDNYDAVHP